MIRIRYIGIDSRPRISIASRVKFLEDGFRPTDNHDEWDDSVRGPVIICHLLRTKGGKRLIMQAPDDFDLEAAQNQVLREGWLDLACCTLKLENLY